VSSFLTAHQHNIGYAVPYTIKITQKFGIYNRFKNNGSSESIRGIVKFQKTMKPNISNKTKNILGVDRVE